MRYIIKEEKTESGFQYCAYRIDPLPGTTAGQDCERYMPGTAASTQERCEMKLRLTLNPEGRIVKELEIDN